jgi:hypothetical protein
MKQDYTRKHNPDLCGVEDKPSAPEPEFDYELVKAADARAQELKKQLFPKKYAPEPTPNYDFAPLPKPQGSDCGV